MQVTVRTVNEAAAEAASRLVCLSFEELVAPDWEPHARQVLLADSSPAAIRENLLAATFAAGAFVNEQMIGFLLMRRPGSLKMLFVHPEWLRRGVGRALWEQARAHVETAFPDVHTVELNATPYAVPFYRSIGFVPISREFVRDGCRVTRMACWLPARALGAEC